VETAAQIEFLRERGCRAAQGYFYSWPVDADPFMELLTRPRTAIPTAGACP
jgi:EAL domain-containing protein (putative c-di-GMP-specific phosphodiesterase class I)